MAAERDRLLPFPTTENLSNGGLTNSISHSNNDFLKSIHTSYVSSRASYGTSTFLSDLGHEGETTYNSVVVMNTYKESLKNPELFKSGTENIKLWNLPIKKKLMLAFLVAGNMIHMMAYSLIAPFFPREAQMKGLSPTVIGFIFSTYMLVSFLISPVYGANISRIGPRFMFIAGLCVGGSCAILFGLLEFCPPGAPFIALCFATRLMEALGMSAHTTVSYAIASNEFANQISTVYGILEAAAAFGFMIGPVAGSFLYEAGGFGLPFYVMGVTTLVGGALVFTCLPKHIDTHEKEQTPKLQMLRSCHIWVILAIVFMSALSNGFIDANLALHAEKQSGVSPVYIGLIFTVWALVYAVTAPFWGWLTDKKDIAVPLIVLGSFTCGVSLLLVGPSPYLPFIPSSVWMLVLALCVHSFGIGWALVPTMKCLIEGTRDLGFGDNLDTFGVVSGLFQCFLSLGAFAGPFVGGMMVESIGFSMSAAIIGFVFWFMTALTVLYFCLRQRC